jgi:hypothetical protein
MVDARPQLCGTVPPAFIEWRDFLPLAGFHAGHAPARVDGNDAAKIFFVGKSLPSVESSLLN